MAEFLADPDFVPCDCPLVSTHVGIAAQRVEYTDGRVGSYRGPRLATALCCGLEFAIVPTDRTTPAGYTDVKPVCLESGEVVRRIAVRTPTPCECSCGCTSPTLNTDPTLCRECDIDCWCAPGGGGYTPISEEPK